MQYPQSSRPQSRHTSSSKRTNRALPPPTQHQAKLDSLLDDMANHRPLQSLLPSSRESSGSSSRESTCPSPRKSISPSARESTRPGSRESIRAGSTPPLADVNAALSWNLHSLVSSLRASSSRKTKGRQPSPSSSESTLSPRAFLLTLQEEFRDSIS